MRKPAHCQGSACCEPLAKGNDLERSAYKTVLGWVAVLAAVYLVQPYRTVVVRGNSMAPTYHNGQLVLMSPLDRPPRDGDVVLVDKDGSTLIKRITMIAGDAYDQLYLRRSDEWVTIHTDATRRAAARALLPVRRQSVPPGKMFIAGDNPSNSLDSRMFGFVDISSIRGLVVPER